MKKIFNMMAVAALFCGVVSNANAEEMVAEAPEVVALEAAEVEVAEAAEAPEAVADTVYVVLRDEANPEFSRGMQASKNNYRNFVQERGLRKWKVEDYVGNDTEEPATLWSANREGCYIGLVGMISNFADNTSYGGGAEIGYLRRLWGISLTGVISNGFEDKTSDVQSQFTQLDVMGRLYLPGLEFRVGKKNGGDVLRIMPYAEFSFKKRSDHHNDVFSETSYEETTDEWIQRTTTTKQNYYAKPHVFGAAGGVKVQYDINGSPLSFALNIDYGRSQNFTYVRGQWHNQLKVGFTASWRIFNNHGYAKSYNDKGNLYLYQDLGRTREEVKKHNL